MPADRIVRDPLWENIRLEPAAAAAIDTPAMQRLRYVRQLGHAFLVYPGATHSRFEHALGAYHLARRALAALAERGDLVGIDERECLAVRLAALLHDLGHYPYSHALEEAGFGDHEAIGARRLEEGELGDLLRSLGGDELVQRIAGLIQGTGDSPLAGLVSGSLDLDKIDYLSRDARMCGVPYGTVDVDRLLASLTLVRHDNGSRETGVHEKGIGALETVLFAKYQMYRNVYWHHAVRSATCMFKRAVAETVARGTLNPADVEQFTDAEIDVVMRRADPTGLTEALRQRRLYKRALDLAASDVPDRIAAHPMWHDLALRREIEERAATALGLPPHGVLIDFPERESMLSVDLPLRTGTGAVERLTDAGRTGALGLPRIAGELYRSARRLRVFTREVREIPSMDALLTE
ncbi:MAG TPA: HD domain-containing protein [Gemmatimonadales bacterium]|jgi:hypothetical protein